MLEAKNLKVNCVGKDTERSYAKYEIAPLARGFGITLGNSLIRILLSQFADCQNNVIKASFVVEEIVDAERMNSDRLILEIWTDGVISPPEALTRATKTLNEYLSEFAKLSEEILCCK